MSSLLKERKRTCRGVPVDRNRGLLLVDGDNFRGTLAKYGMMYLTLDRLKDWVADPANLGIDRLVGACIFLTGMRSWAIPIQNHKGWDKYLFRRGPGYADQLMYEQAERLIDSFDTLVIVSSDGGASDGDGGVFEFARQLRENPDPARRREAVVIASHVSAPRGWTRQAGRHAVLEDIYPELAPVLPWIMYRPTVHELYGQPA